MLKGLATRGAIDPNKSSFRSSWTRSEGAVPALIHECKVFDVNTVNWTVDCITVFDQKRFFDVQVASPYMHSTAGEGIYVMPEVGAKCYVCIPSDGPPPFVLGFIMPLSSVRDDTAEDAGGSAGSARFDGGRPKAKPGDIMISGRDGNFMRLHRGGVAEFGASPLAQRICIPLGNLVTDISQNYNHFNSGGSINWGVTNLDDAKPQTEYKHTFRVFANDKFADIRTTVGKVRVPVPEPGGDDGTAVDMAEFEMAQGDAAGTPIVFELVLAPGGFDTDAGNAQSGIQKLTKLRFLFDRKGGVMLRSESSVILRVKKKLRITADEGLELISGKGMNIEAGTVGRLFAADSMEIGTNGGVLKMNGGTKPVAHVGSIVKIVIPMPIPITVGGSPGTITAGAAFEGIVTTGNPTCLV